MAIYTIDLWELVEHYGLAWLNEYPLEYEDHRDALNRMILDTYWNREIGVETPSMFFVSFRNHMSLNMPVFNELYKSQRIQFDPMITTKLETTTDATTESSSATSGTSESKSLATETSESVSSSNSEGMSVSYAFPQTRLADRKDYATSAGDSEQESTNTADSSGSSNRTDEGSDSRNTTTEGADKAKSVTVGYQGVPADLINAFRATIINVDQMVINSLEPLFMGIWGTNSRRIERR